MRFGINFFPSCDPSLLSGQAYYRQALALAARADELGYHHIRTVEHYFRGYGDYSPSPIVFLPAVAQRTQRVRLVTGAVLPAFNHPIKLATELAMLDCISDGRLEAGFARAFLSEELDAFQAPMEESRARFEEGIAVVKQLWTEQEVRFDGPFHQFGPVEPSLQVIFGDISEAAARRSLELFATEVMPRLTDLSSDPSQF